MLNIYHQISLIEMREAKTIGKLCSSVQSDIWYFTYEDLNSIRDVYIRNYKNGYEYTIVGVKNVE